MRITSSGNVGIGNTASGFNAQADNLIVGSGSGANGITIYSGNDSTGDIFFADGTSGDDPVRGGINYNHVDNSMNFRVNDAARMYITSSGNVGIGVVPEAWQSTRSALQVGDSTAVWGDVFKNSWFTNNVYRNSSNNEVYINDSYASEITMTNAGVMDFKVAPSGSADATISWTTAISIANSGNVEITTGNLKVTNLVITTKSVDLTTSLQDLIQVGNRCSYKITVSVGDGSGGERYGHTVAFVSCSDDTAKQGTIRQENGATLILSWKAVSGTSADAHTLQARNSDGTANQHTIMVESLSRYVSAGSGTGNGQLTILL
jgi:hypothetical protein